MNHNFAFTAWKLYMFFTSLPATPQKDSSFHERNEDLAGLNVFFFKVFSANLSFPY